MEVLLRLGQPSTQGARIVCRSDTAGQLTAVCDGQTFTGSIVNPATNDGVGYIDITGLNSNSEYAYSIFLDGVFANSATLKTMPAMGQNFSVGFGSCFGLNREFYQGYTLARDACCFITQGDIPYLDGATVQSTDWGEPSIVVGHSDASEANIRRHYRQPLRHPGIGHLVSRIPWIAQTDDHERIGNDWDYSIGSAGVEGANYYGTVVNTQGEADALGRLCVDVFKTYHYDAHPLNSDPNNDPDSNGDNLYFRFTIGSVEFFVLECIEYRDKWNPATGGKTNNDPTKTMLGATQLQWLKDRLKASTAPFKCIVSSKEFFGEQDGWNYYEVERDDIISYVHAATDWIAPGGVFAISGDTHTPIVTYRSATPFLNVVACSAGVNIKQASDKPETIFRPVTSAEQQDSTYNNIGIISVSGSEYVELKIVTSINKTLWSGRIYAGSNELIYPDTNISI